jgi:hypothetical protein
MVDFPLFAILFHIADLVCDMITSRVGYFVNSIWTVLNADVASTQHFTNSVLQ